jgi:acetyltransferase-like isoleucine patch superfamily enzyme
MGFIRKWIKRYLCSMGFMNYDRPQVEGPKKRFHSMGTIESNVYFNTNSGSIFVGKNVTWGHNVMVITGKHLFDGKSFFPYSKEGRDIIISDGCWIASGAMINGGVKIGRCALVCAGAVVTKDVPDGAVVAGIPAVVIRHVKIQENSNVQKISVSVVKPGV